MIRINLDQETKLKIEKEHWDYFQKASLVLLEKKAESEKNLLRKKLYILLLDKEKNYALLKSLIFGHPKEHRIIVEKVNSLINEEIGEYDIESWELKINHCQNNMLFPSKFKGETLDEHISEIKNFTSKIETFQEKYNQYGEINTVLRAKELAKDLKNQLKNIAEIHKQKTKDRNDFCRELFKNIDSVFDYEKFSKSDQNWGAYPLLKVLNIRTCPYCNRLYTNTMISHFGKTRPALDHFYPKSRYPYLAISLYNLIPSCQVCNSSLKGSKDFYKKEHIHPYIEEFGNDAVFRTDFDLDSGDTILSELTNESNLDKLNLKLKISDDSSLKVKLKNSSDTFCIEEIYQNHKDYVLEVLKKTVLYNKSRILELASSEEYKDLFSGPQEIVQILIGNYLKNKELGNRVLSKLTRDIWEEFKLDEVWNSISQA